MSQSKDSFSLKYLHLYSDPIKAWVSFIAMSIACYTSFWLVDNTVDAQIIRVASGSYIVYCLPLAYDYFSRIGYQPKHFLINRLILNFLGCSCLVTSILAILFALQLNPYNNAFLLYRIITPILLIINFIDACTLTNTINYQEDETNRFSNAKQKQQKFEDRFSKVTSEKGKRL